MAIKISGITVDGIKINAQNISGNLSIGANAENGTLVVNGKAYKAVRGDTADITAGVLRINGEVPESDNTPPMAEE